VVGRSLLYRFAHHPVGAVLGQEALVDEVRQSHSVLQPKLRNGNLQSLVGNHRNELVIVAAREPRVTLAAVHLDPRQSCVLMPLDKDDIDIMHPFQRALQCRLSVTSPDVDQSVGSKKHHLLRPRAREAPRVLARNVKGNTRVTQMPHYGNAVGTLPEFAQQTFNKRSLSNI
jgi:hypothetical protein